VVKDSQFRVEKVQAPARFIFSGLYGFCMFLYSDVGMFEFPINIKKKPNDIDQLSTSGFTTRLCFSS
jgi:hypothetical protein